MRKMLILMLALLLLCLCACSGAGETVDYDTAHEHVYGFWYEAHTEDGVRRQVRYCKICHAAQEQTVQE